MTLLALLTLACRGKISSGDLNEKNFDDEKQPAADTPPAPELPPLVQPPQPPLPADVKNALTSGRIRYQTRQTIRMQLTGGIIRERSRFTLMQMPSGSPLIKEHGFGESLASGAGYHYVFSSPSAATLSLFPAKPELRGKLVYGVNQLKLLTDDPSAPAFTTASFTLKDFNVLDTGGVLHFPESRQVRDGYQGALAPLTGTVVAGDGAKLTVGAFSLINR